MTRSRAVFMLVLMALVGLTAPTPAREIEEIRDELIEALVALEADLESYDLTREDETTALIDLQQTSEHLDNALTDPAASVDLLRRLERDVEGARARLNAAARQSTELRGDLFSRMEQVQGLLDAVERAGVELVPAGKGLTGTWRVEVIGEEIHGVFSFRQEGSLVRGSYRTMTGALGSVHGTVTGGQLRLEMVDSERGIIGEITGALDERTGRLEGVWDGREVGSGLATRLDWEGQRLSLDLLLEQR